VRALITVSLSLLAAPAWAVDGASDPGAMALLPLVASGLATDETVALQAVVGRAAATYWGSKMIPPATVDQRLEKAGAKGVRRDRNDPSCSAQIGAVAGADVVVVATFVASSPSSSLAVRLVGVDETAQVAYAAGPVGDEPTVDEIVAVLAKTDAPEARALSLGVTGPAGASVLVDGVEQGALPLAAPLTSLPAGPHDVVVRGPDAAIVHEQHVELRPGEPAVVDAPLPASKPLEVATPQPAPSSSPVPMIVVASGGGAAVLGAVALVVGVLPFSGAQAANDDVSRLEAEVKSDPGLLDERADDIRGAQLRYEKGVDDWRSWGAPLAVVGGVAVAAGVVAAGVGAFLWAE
jgi:hypothetical protein